MPMAYAIGPGVKRLRSAIVRCYRWAARVCVYDACQTQIWITSMKILIADDHQLVIEAVKAKLVELDAKVSFVAVTTLEALAAIDVVDIDLALIDLGMPGAEGILHVRQLRERNPAMPIIVLSGTSDTVLMRETLDSGAMGFIPKAYSSEVMLLAVKLVLAGGVYVPPALLTPVPSAPGVRSGAGLSMDSVRQVLTARQVEVLDLLSQGKPNKLIGRSLGISEGTVKIHLAAIFRALNARNRTEAVVVAQHLMMQEGPVGPALGEHH